MPAFAPTHGAKWRLPARASAELRYVVVERSAQLACGVGGAQELADGNERVPAANALRPHRRLDVELSARRHERRRIVARGAGSPAGPAHQCDRRKRNDRNGTDHFANLRGSPVDRPCVQTYGAPIAAASRRPCRVILDGSALQGALPIPQADDDHYWLVASRILAGKVVPFLGAGANLVRAPRRRAVGSSASTCRAGASWPRSSRAQPLPARRGLRPAARLAVRRRRARRARAVRVAAHDVRRRLPADGAAPLLAGLPGCCASAGRRRCWSSPPTTTTRSSGRSTRAASPTTSSGTAPSGRRPAGSFMHRRPTATASTITRPNEYPTPALDERTVILKLHGAVDRARPEARQLRDHRGQLHRLPHARRTSRARSRSRCAAKLRAQPLPLPRLQPARLEPARDPPPALGRAGARRSSPGRSSASSRAS